MAVHIVKQGEHLAGIARARGFSNWDAIWSAAPNAELKRKRDNPNILLPGDRVFIPEREEHVETRAAEQRHRFRRKMKKLKLRLVLKDIHFRPLAKKNCTLRVDGAESRLTTQANGLIELEIPPAARQARLLVDDPELSMVYNVPLEIGRLDPVDTLTGQKARLNNLGYFSGPVDPEDTPLFRSAVEEFQLEHLGKNEVDGKCGPKTRARLKEVYGC